MAGPYYCDYANGLDTNTGLSEALAFKTVQKASTVVADGEIVYIQSGTTYDEATVPTITNIGVQWIGYTTTIADGGTAKIDAGTNSIASCLKINQTTGANDSHVRNLELTGGTSHGVDFNRTGGGLNSRHIVDNCWIHANGGAGIVSDTHGIIVSRSEIDNNTGDGCNFGLGAQGHRLINSKVHDNGGLGVVSTGAAVLVNSEVYDNAQEGVSLTTGGGTLVNSTVHDNGTTGDDGAYGNALVLVACGLTDNFRYNANTTLVGMSFNSGFNGAGTADTNGTWIAVEDVTSAPSYAGATDFTAGTAGWKGVTLEIGVVSGTHAQATSTLDIGSIQQAAGGMRLAGKGGLAA